MRDLDHPLASKSTHSPQNQFTAEGELQQMIADLAGNSLEILKFG